MTLSQADILEYYLRDVEGVKSVSVYDRTCDAVILFDAAEEARCAVVRAVSAFRFDDERALSLVPEHTSRELNRDYQDKLVFCVMRRIMSKLFLPIPIRTALTVLRSLRYLKAALAALWHRRLSVAVLDGTAVAVSVLRGDFSTAASVMFMLHIGEILEEWTHKKSVADLAGAMSLNVDKVWNKNGDI